MAKQYKITSVSQMEDNLVTGVDFQFTSPDVSETTVVSVSICHFRPASIDDITTAISNRADSELDKLSASATAATVLDQVSISSDYIML